MVMVMLMKTITYYTDLCWREKTDPWLNRSLHHLSAFTLAILLQAVVNDLPYNRKSSFQRGNDQITRVNLYRSTLNSKLNPIALSQHEPS